MAGRWPFGRHDLTISSTIRNDGEMQLELDANSFQTAVTFFSDQGTVAELSLAAAGWVAGWDAGWD